MPLYGLFLEADGDTLSCGKTICHHPYLSDFLKKP